jgi:acrylyl-CoA reductase (NADPH)/3-hydroxypropionyl-CoA dehydratase/3-hydroxypropionyl-CoA synthetase
MVSSAERAERVEAVGGAAVDRKDPKWAAAFTSVPDDPSQWAAWEDAGVDFVEAAKTAAGGDLNYAVSHAGETAFPRTFQTLGDGGVLTFYGASSGYRFTFMGKKGESSPAEMFTRAWVACRPKLTDRLWPRRRRRHCRSRGH